MPYRPLQYRADIDGLRALAVLAVLAFHAFPETVRGGFIGVDVFFVISGYVITRIVHEAIGRGDFSLSDFFARRIRRIFPALITVMLACFAFGWFALMGHEYAGLGKHMAASGTFVLNLLLWQEGGYFEAAAITKPLQHLWSLAIEGQFYLLWPFLLLMLQRFRMNIATLVVTVTVLSFAANIFLMHDRIEDFYASYTRWWELLLGALVACIPAGEKRGANMAACAGAALLVLGMVLITPGQFYPGELALLPTIGTALLIASGQAAWLNRRLLSHRPLPWIGRISYPLYLWHWPLFSFASIMASGALPLWQRWALLGASFVLAVVTYRFIERPLRFGGSKQQVTLRLLIALMVVAGVGLVTYQQHGFSGRAASKHYVDNSGELLRTPNVDAACLQYLGLQQSPSTYCRYTDAKGSKTVALIGDSHAHTSYPGIAEMLQQRGINTLMLGNAGCPPLRDSEGEAMEDSRGACARQTAALLAPIIAHKDITRVVIFSRGAVYITPSPDARVTAAALETQFVAHLQATIDLLHGHDKAVYYVFENPQMPLMPAACIPRPLRRTIEVCEVERSIVEKEQATYRALVKQVRPVTLIDPMETLCDAAHCRMLQDGVLLYADDIHLSVAGSHYQAQHLFARYLIPAAH